MTSHHTGSSAPRQTGRFLADLPDGYATPAEVDGAKVLLIRLGDEVRAVSSWCTHMRTLITEQQVAEDGLVECPMHGALFDSTDGSLQMGPECDALPVYAVEVATDGSVAVRIDASEAAAVPRTSGFGTWGAVRS